MTLFSYEIFDAVARQGSFNKAAQQLHLTPSAISHAIAVMNSDEALKQSIARLNGLEKGKVKLGAFNSVCAGMLPGILKGFMAQYPQIEVEVYQGTYDDVKEWLRTGQIDLAFNIAMVEAGLGISIMPRLLLSQCTANIKIYPIDPEEDRVVGLAVQRPTAMAPAVEQMFHHIVDYCKQMEH